MLPLPILALRDVRDRLAVALSCLPLAAMACVPEPWCVAVCVWWLGNTVAHHATHRRFFVKPAAERAFGLWLTLLLGVPQRLWQQRHLAHHAGRRWRPRWDARVKVESAALAGAWVVAGCAAPHWLVSVYAPGLAGGLLLAFVHGHFEHKGGTTSMRARWWNVLLLNDGYHVEHHLTPRRHWRELPAVNAPAGRSSCWPPPLRWLSWLQPAAWLDAAERCVLRSPALAAAVLAAHRRALAAVLAIEPAPRHIVIVGGGLFPRSAILLRERYPKARITVLDAEASHLAAAAPLLPPGVERRVVRVTPGIRLDADLVVLPLALRGARRAFLLAPPAPRLLVHDWCWAQPGRGKLVAWWLCKRVYLVRADVVAAAARSA